MKKKRLFLGIAIAAAALLGLASCGDETNTTTETTNQAQPTETGAPSESTNTTPSAPTAPTAPAHEHTYTSKVTKEATCTEDGVKTYTCACGDTYTEVIPATGHTPVTDPATAPTHKAVGKTEGSHCEVCGGIIVPQTDIPKIPHTFTEVISYNQYKESEPIFAGSKYAKSITFYKTCECGEDSEETFTINPYVEFSLTNGEEKEVVSTVASYDGYTIFALTNTNGLVKITNDISLFDGKIYDEAGKEVAITNNRFMALSDKTYYIVVNENESGETKGRFVIEEANFTIEDIFTIDGEPTFVGKVNSGSISVGDKLSYIKADGVVTEVTVSGIRALNKNYEYTYAGQYSSVGITFEEITDKTGLTREDQIISPRIDLGEKTKVLTGTFYAYIKEEGGRHTPFMNDFKPYFRVGATEVQGTVALPSGLDMFIPGEAHDITVTLSKEVYINIIPSVITCRDGSTNVGYLVLDKADIDVAGLEFHSAEYDTVNEETVKVIDRYYSDAEGNIYTLDITNMYEPKLVEESSIPSDYTSYFGVNGTQVITGRGILVFVNYDPFAYTENLDLFKTLTAKKCVVVFNDGTTKESVITMADYDRTLGKYGIICRGISAEEAENIVRVYTVE